MAEQTMEEAVILEHDLLPCVICGRTFLPTPLAKHTRVCERNATRKRKIFDSLKQRVEGTDLAPFHQKSYLKKADVAATHKSEPRQSKWKEKHLELVNAIRAAKGSSTVSMPSTLAKRSSTTLGTPTHERCPSCDRQFGPKAFDRHVEWCKDKKTTIHKSPASVVLAKERLEARTKYKVPPLNKSKRALTREKYSPQMNRAESIVTMKSVSACALDRNPSIRKSKNLLHNKKSADRMDSNGSQDEYVAEKIIKEKAEKSVGDTSVKAVHSEKYLTKEKRPAEPVKSFGYSGSTKEKKKDKLASLKRSISLLDPVQKPKPLKNKQDVQNYFNEQELKSPVKKEKSPVPSKIEPVLIKPIEESSHFVPKAEDLFSVDDEMYEEYKKYEEMYLKEKEEQLKKEERRISDGQSGLLTASEDDDSQQQSVKLSGDSAYGSLNRKTPKVRARSTKLTPLDSQRNLAAESPNSSSSESSPINPLSSDAPKMSKFCHECGNRYPLNTAKFCVECGVRRLVL